MQEPKQLSTDVSTPTLEKTPKMGHVLFISSIALIVAVISLVFQFFFWQLHKKTEANVLFQQEQLMQALEPKLRTLNAELNNQQKTISVILARTQAEDKKNSIMVVQEVEHILTLAQYNLAFENNINLAIKLLGDAHQKLEQLNDPALIPLQKSLIADLTTLNTLPKVDVASLIARISAIADQVATLSDLPVIPAPPKLKTHVPAHLTWKERLMETFRRLQGIITIRRLPEAVVPLPSPEQQVYIVESIRLKLGEAQWAVLHQNTALYLNSLEETKKQLQKYYQHNPAGAKLVTMINELQQINIKPSVPDLNNTLALLHSYIHNLQQSLTTNVNSIQNPTPDNMPNVKLNSKMNSLPQTVPNPTPRALPS